MSRFPSLAETFVLSQMTGLIDRGHEVRILVRGGGDEVVHADVERYGLMDVVRRYVEKGEGALLKRAGGWRGGFASRALNPFVFGRRGLSRRILREGVAWVEAVREFGMPDVVVAHHGGNGENAVRLRRAGAFDAPVVTFFHGSDANRAGEKGGGKFAELFAKGDLVCAVSEYIRGRLVEIGCDPARLVVQRMGVRMPGGEVVSREARSDGLVRFVSVSRLVEVKGLAYSIRAFAGLPEKVRAGCSYAVVGDGPLRGELEGLARELGVLRGVAGEEGGRVVFTGGLPSEAVWDRLRGSDVFVFPSVVTASGENEALGIAMVEAMGAGLSVIASRTGGIPEVAVDGETALLCEPGDVSGLAAAMLRLAEDAGLRARLGGAASRFVRAEYDHDLQNDRLLALLEGLVSG